MTVVAVHAHPIATPTAGPDRSATRRAVRVSVRLIAVDRARQERPATHRLVPVIEFLKLKDIRVVYASNAFSSKLTFLSQGDVVGTEYNEPPYRGKKQRVESAKEVRFAVLLDGDNNKDLTLFEQYLSEGGVQYQVESIRNFRVLWEFRGDGDVVDGLRSIAGPF